MESYDQYGSVLINRLRLLLNPYASLEHLECDGLTHVFHRILSDEDIEHTINIGQVIHKPTNRTIGLHYWIDVADLRIDYRLRMWLGATSDIPHGVFFADLEKSVSYIGEPQEIPLLPQPIIQILVKPFNSQF